MGTSRPLVADQRTWHVGHLCLCLDKACGGVLPPGREEERWSEETRTSGEDRAQEGSEKRRSEHSLNKAED